MRERIQQVDADRAEATTVDLDQFASYEDDDSFVVCDRKDPNAWVESDTTTRIRP